jgi:hypothetical protein
MNYIYVFCLCVHMFLFRPMDCRFHGGPFLFLAEQPDPSEASG